MCGEGVYWIFEGKRSGGLREERTKGCLSREALELKLNIRIRKEIKSV